MRKLPRLLLVVPLAVVAAYFMIIGMNAQKPGVLVLPLVGALYAALAVGVFVARHPGPVSILGIVALLLVAVALPHIVPLN